MNEEGVITSEAGSGSTVQGEGIAAHIADEARERVLIVGAGPVGLACAISAVRRGLNPLVIDSGAIVMSIVHYPAQMGFFTSPELMEIGGHPLVCASAKPTREEAMMYYRGVVRTEGIRVRTYTRLLGASRSGGLTRAAVRGLSGEYIIDCERMVLSTGYYDNPRMLGVPGETLPHVKHYFDEAHLSTGLDVVVIGGKNSAAEAALLLWRAGARVTMVVRGDSLGESVKYWLRPDIENRIKAGEITALLKTRVVEFRDGAVLVRDAAGESATLKADRVYALTGYLPDTDLFRRIGIHINAESGRPEHDASSHETNVSGVFVAGSICAGYRTSDIFIENGRFDGEKIFASVPLRS
jgi:thioredoxin reductase (NADPH)